MLYNSSLVGIRLIAGSESGRTPSPFKPTTGHFLLLDFLNVPRGTRANILGLGSTAIFRCVNFLPPLPKCISRECIFYLTTHIIWHFNIDESMYLLISPDKGVINSASVSFHLNTLMAHKVPN